MGRELTGCVLPLRSFCGKLREVLSRVGVVGVIDGGMSVRRGVHGIELLLEGGIG